MKNNPLLENESGYKIGYRFGAAILILGVAVVGFNFVMLINSDLYYPKMLTAGIALFLLGPAFMIFPGKPVSQKPAMRNMISVLLTHSSAGQKGIWIVWAIVSIVLAFYLMTQLDPLFWE